MKKEPGKSPVIKVLLKNVGGLELDEKTLRVLEEFHKASVLINRTYLAMGKFPVVNTSNASTSQTPTLIHGIISTNQVQVSTGLV